MYTIITAIIYCYYYYSCYSYCYYYYYYQVQRTEHRPGPRECLSWRGYVPFLASGVDQRTVVEAAEFLDQGPSFERIAVDSSSLRRAAHGKQCPFIQRHEPKGSERLGRSGCSMASEKILDCKGVTGWLNTADKLRPTLRIPQTTALMYPYPRTSCMNLNANISCTGNPQ